MLAPDESVRIAIECKATRMGVGARFGDNPGAERGYEEIARGVFQIWRFLSHCRRGLTGRSAAPDAFGMILTLDEWFAGRGPLLNAVLVRATGQSLLAVLTMAEGDHRGWILSSLHADLDDPKTDPKPYPFADALDELLPWHARIGELAMDEAD
jgi:hypothetical protein